MCKQANKGKFKISTKEFTISSQRLQKKKVEYFDKTFILVAARGQWVPDPFINLVLQINKKFSFQAYLEKYGYMNKSDTDIETRIMSKIIPTSAILDFQKFFNLNQTGKLLSTAQLLRNIIKKIFINLQEFNFSKNWNSFSDISLKLFSNIISYFYYASIRSLSLRHAFLG